MKKLCGVIAAVVLLAGCGAQEDAVVEQEVSMPSDTAVVYDCQGQEVKADYNNETEPQTAQLFFTGKVHEDMILPLVVSASGAKYSDGTVTFWTHQGEATLMMESDGASIMCTQKNMIDDEKVIMDSNNNTVTPGCTSWFDGCNTCVVNKDGTLGCTKKYCTSEMTQPARCMSEV